MDSTQEFIDSNTKDKMKIKDILTSTKEKIDKSKDKKNAAKLQEGYTAIGKERISDIRETKTQNVFEAMVYSLAKTALKNEDAKNGVANGILVSVLISIFLSLICLLFLPTNIIPAILLRAILLSNRF